jgi:oxygen-independent coproporphyrinogen-3 oxidase
MDVRALLDGSPYVTYAYGYPHKTAYRPLPAPIPLAELWRPERRDALSLYLHVPFCEMRCGFCNLFTQVRPEEDAESAYLDTLERQAQAVVAALGEARYARAAVGGGTPTWLSPEKLHRLLALAERVLGAPIARVPMSVETSPETATPERLAVLRGFGVQRVSIGVQSFLDEESRAAGRPQRRDRVEAALAALRAAAFPTVNVDLMYGLPGQTEATLAESIGAALAFGVEELYLYPLYVRPLTGLGKRGRAWDDHRLALYRAGRALLLDEGFVQLSMRRFRRRGAGAAGGVDDASARRASAGDAGRASAGRTGVGDAGDAPEFSCQNDGMVGLGCGARSYTRTLHWSEEFAVGARGVREILAAYVARSDASLGQAWYGAPLDAAEQRRRFVILSLLGGGLDEGAFRARFGAAPALPELTALVEAGLVRRAGPRLTLTEGGLERSDAIGPFLFSPAVRDSMSAFSLR